MPVKHERGMRRPREFQPTQTGTNCGVVLPLPCCTRFVQTVACQLETPLTVPRIGPCGERALRPHRPCVDDDDDDDKTRSKQRIATLPEEARATAIGSMYTQAVHVWRRLTGNRKWKYAVGYVLFRSLAVLDPKVGHTMDVLSPFVSVLCHSD